ncbi:MAG TPA: GRP family sugar transporter [Acidobacteriaceae bacterium]|nr:GRP family sugar transporter [Acidobacteriaceae bacterium]
MTSHFDTKHSPATDLPSALNGHFALGIVCALAAGAWLGAAEAPARLAASGFGPFAISFCMVGGVFLARWTLPIAAKGTRSVARDLLQRPHLMIWAVVAGGLWAVANTLTIFAIRDVGLSIAFPLWNTNSLIGIFWGWALFHELDGASTRSWLRVAGGAAAIVLGSVLLSALSVHTMAATPGRAAAGIAAALGAGVLWGTMYVPYRKAYLSGINPLSFVTIFTFGELGTMFFLAIVLPGGLSGLGHQLASMRSSIFWLLLGGFCWVIGDLFQQYATKYVGISRAIPLSNTNQLWGFAWGVLVFGELAGTHGSVRLMALGASAITIFGAMLIAGTTVSSAESASTVRAIRRECDRYDMDMAATLQTQTVQVTNQPAAAGRRSWFDYLILLAAVAIFVWFGHFVRMPQVALSIPAVIVLTAILFAVLCGAGWLLWKKTRFD